MTTILERFEEPVDGDILELIKKSFENLPEEISFVPPKGTIVGYCPERKIDTWYKNERCSKMHKTYFD